MVRHLRIELLADHPEHVETLARWHCEEDGHADGGASLDFWRRQCSTSTASARGLYERLGWRHLWDEVYEGEPVAVLSINASSASRRRSPSSGA